MEEKHKAMLELAAKAIGEARELFAERRNARAAASGSAGRAAGYTARPGGSEASIGVGGAGGVRGAGGAAASGDPRGNPASGAEAPGAEAEPEAADVRLLSLVDGSGLGWLMEDEAERGRFLEELEARIAAAAGPSSGGAPGK